MANHPSRTIASAVRRAFRECLNSDTDRIIAALGYLGYTGDDVKRYALALFDADSVTKAVTRYIATKSPAAFRAELDGRAIGYYYTAADAEAAIRAAKRKQRAEPSSNF